MGVLLSLLSLLLVTAARGGGCATSLAETTVPYYSSVSDVIAYWQTVLPNSTIPQAILEHLSYAGDDDKVTFQWGAHTKEDDEKVTIKWAPHVKADDEKVTFRWGMQRNENGKKVIVGWGPHVQTDDKKVTFRWSPYTKEDDGKTTFRWDLGTKGDEKVTFRWGPYKKEDDGKVTFQGSSSSKEDDKKVTFQRGPHTEGGDKKVTLRWGQQTAKDEHGDEKLQWGQQTSRDEGGDEKVTLRWGQQTSEDERGDKKVNLQWGQHTNGDEGGDEKVTFRWGQNTNRDGGDQKVTFGWGHQHTNEDDEKVTFRWGTDGQKIPYLPQSSHVREGHHHELHETGHNHGPFNFANILFSEAMLTPGNMITPYIEPSVVPTPFLRRDVADSIPISTKNFTDVMSKFAPVSFTMADKIWSTLRTCEHPHPLEGEQQACATSVESMVELAMSVVGTCNVHAFSSSTDVPVEGLAPPPSRRYAVAAVRAVTAPGEPATTMTCHGVTFPYAVFYCHAVNPTRVYEVTLRRSTEEEDGAAVAADEMRVLAVCHLDTSRFDPDNPYFVARGLKSGDAAVCHFLSRDSVLWAPAASAHGHGQAAAQ